MTGFFTVKRKKHEKMGFSLVEMLIVVALILILLGIVMPRFKFMKSSAKVLEAKHGLADFYRQQQSFHIENGHYGQTVENIGFEFDSKNYIVGFKGSFKGAVIKQTIGASCLVDPSGNSFRAGSANEGNKLLNFTINEKNCLQKLKDKTSECNQTVSSDCITR